MIVRIFIIIYITILSIQSRAISDEISEFQIEGISIGDNLLDHYSKEKIDSHKRFYPASKKFYFGAFRIDSENYDAIQFSAKNDKSNIIHSISGKILFEDKFNECQIKMREIINDLEISLPKDISKVEKPLSKMINADKSGKSVHIGTLFYFQNDDYISVECLDWSEESNYLDNLKVRFSTNIYNDWLLNEAYK